jgi:predicted HAD superfamily phosphohydrolase YqeG
MRIRLLSVIGEALYSEIEARHYLDTFHTNPVEPLKNQTKMTKPANKAMERTRLSVTPRAFARVAPVSRVAHL